MKQIEIRKQVRLGLGKCVEMVLSGVRFRLFRAAVTVVIIALAAAFLMTMLSESLIAREVRGDVKARLAPRDQFRSWVGRLSVPMTRRELGRELAGVEPGGPRWQEFKAWGDLTDEQLSRLHEIGAAQVDYLRFFRDLFEGDRRALFGRARETEIFDHLSEQRRFEDFGTTLRNLGLLSLMPGELSDLEAFLENWAATNDLRTRIIEGHRAAIAQFEETLEPGLSVPQFLAQAGEDLPEQLRPFGFRMTPQAVSVVREQAQLNLRAEQLTQLVKIQAVKTRLATRRKISQVGDVNEQMMLEEVKSTGGAEWLLGVLDDLSRQAKQLREQLPGLRQAVEEQRERVEALGDRAQELRRRLRSLRREDAPEEQIQAAASQFQEAEQEFEDASTELRNRTRELRRVQTESRNLLPAEQTLRNFDLTAGQIASVAQRRLHERELAEVEANLLQGPSDEDAFLSFTPRTQWLIVVSFLVCAVGISNAMLMSVTERFQEIATMKCLGATDRFIMINFILESVMQGVAGGVVGTVLGLLLGMLRGSANYGLLALTNLPPGPILIAGCVSLVVGVVVSALAAVYPAWVAARLAPMEAMRIE